MSGHLGEPVGECWHTGAVLPELARGAVDDLLGRLDRVVPDRIEGFYVVGSASMGAFCAGRSDVDFVAIVNGALGRAELARLRAMHVGRCTAAVLHDVAYLCRAVLVEPPEGFEVVEVGRVRAGAQAYLGPRPGVGSPAGDMMVDGVLFPLGEALRPLGLWRPSTRTWRQQHAGSRPRCIGDIQALRAREVSRRRERLVSEFSKCVVAAFEQLASKRQARAVTAEPLGGLPVVVAVRRPWTPGGLGGLV